MFDQVLPLKAGYLYTWVAIITLGFCAVMFDAISRNDFQTAGWVFLLIVFHTAASPLIAVGTTTRVSGEPVDSTVD